MTQRIFGGKWRNWTAAIWWLVALLLLSLPGSWRLGDWLLLGTCALETSAILWRWRAWAKSAHKPHVDPDWHALVHEYRRQDLRTKRDPFTWLEELLWVVAAWAPFGAKMIWREAPYMARIYLTPWWFPRQVFLHRILLSDNGIHNHPYKWSCSLILTGGYLETRKWRESTLGFGWCLQENSPKRWLNWIPAGAFHAIALDQGPVWTLFFCGPRDRDWGFLDSAGGFHPVGEAQRPDGVQRYGVPGESLILPPPRTDQAAAVHEDSRSWLGEIEIDLDETQPMTTVPQNKS